MHTEYKLYFNNNIKNLDEVCLTIEKIIDKKAFTFNLCLGGGIGRRKGLKIPWGLSPWEFDSPPRHQ